MAFQANVYSKTRRQIISKGIIAPQASGKQFNAPIGMMTVKI